MKAFSENIQERIDGEILGKKQQKISFSFEISLKNIRNGTLTGWLC